MDFGSFVLCLAPITITIIIIAVSYNRMTNPYHPPETHTYQPPPPPPPPTPKPPMVWLPDPAPPAPVRTDYEKVNSFAWDIAMAMDSDGVTLQGTELWEEAARRATPYASQEIPLQVLTAVTVTAFLEKMKSF